IPSIFSPPRKASRSSHTVRSSKRRPFRQRPEDRDKLKSQAFGFLSRVGGWKVVLHPSINVEQNDVARWDALIRQGVLLRLRQELPAVGPALAHLGEHPQAHLQRQPEHAGVLRLSSEHRQVLLVRPS